MSETNEHSVDDTETETKTVEDLPNDSVKSEVKLMMNQTDTALLEDEEMPTYISVSSTSRPNDSDVVNAKQRENVSQEIQENHSTSPAPSDDEEASSVYVVSSEEETEHEDEDGDSEDMENLELDNEFDSEHHLHELNMKHLNMMDEEDDEEEEDEEDDEEGFRHIYNDGNNIDLSNSDRMSDDFLFNRRIKNNDKEKSLSLQDLSVCMNNMYTGHPKNSHLRPGYLNIPNAMMYSTMHRKPGPAKYQHVESRVKRYIKDMKELTRRSLDKQKHYQESAVQNQNNTDYKINDAEKSKTPNKIIKDYAERTIKQLEIEESCDGDTPPYNATATAILNGQDNKNGLLSIHEESTQDEVQINETFDATQNENDPLNIDDKIQKQNGIESKEYNIHDRQTPISFASVTVQQPPIQNGHQDMPTVFYNLRTVTYQDYMRGPSHATKMDLNKTIHPSGREQTQPETYNDAEPMEVTIENDVSCPIKIENIKSIGTMGDEVKNNIEQATFDKNEGFNKVPSHVLAVVELKEKLDMKTAQYDNLLEAYKKQLEENYKLKQEAEELRTSLANEREKKKKPPEQKVVSIQTDITDCTPNKEKRNKAEESARIRKHSNKVATNSIGSTLSSIEQWSDSSGTLSISMKPPEAAKVSHSDDSMMLIDPTPKKLSPSLSHAFITSSRILKTLSNITQGKPQSESPRVQNSKRRLNENAETDTLNDDSGCQTRPSSSKKRKIADIFKSLHAAAESHSDVNKTSNGESQFKYSCDSANDKVKLQETSSNDTNHLKLAANSETQNDDCYPEDNVKCYVYQENENNKDRSFLILAEEPKDDKTGNEKGRIRECGPYLLGNIEVRMSEINGTINIWGKEISQSSIVEPESETDTSTAVKDDKNGPLRTPYIKFNGSNLVCSTSKKSSPKFDLSLGASSNVSCIHASSFNTKPSCSTEKANATDPYSTCVSSREDCESSKHKECPHCKQTHNQEKLHSCCIHDTDTLEHNCSLNTEKQKFQDNCDHSKEKLSRKECQRSFLKSVEPNKHLYGSSVNAEDTCRCYAVRHSHNHEESHKCRKHVCACEPESETSKYLSPMCEDEPLIEKYNETPETRRRRTGKRVRGILMDLLRDCCSPGSKSCIHKKESSTGCTPQIKFSPCASAERSCSNPRHPVGRCCRAYAQRIESQLEEFRVEMERVRSRSDAILNMLNMLHSVDSN